MPTYPKSSCCVPFCPRWSRRFRPGSEWLCGTHWRLVDRRLKRLLKRAAKEWDREAETIRTLDSVCVSRDPMGYTDEEVNRHLAAQTRVRRRRSLYWLTWRKMKAQAIARAATSFL